MVTTESLQDTYKWVALVPRLARAVTWSCGRAHGAGSPRDRQKLLLALFRVLQDPEDDGHVVDGEGGHGGGKSFS